MNTWVVFYNRRSWFIAGIFGFFEVGYDQTPQIHQWDLHIDQ